jgi:hypothetical protein
MASPMDTLEDVLSSEVLLDINYNENEIMDVEEVSRFQKENHLLKNLPYYKELQSETEEYLDKIITNLAKSILCNDFQLGVVIYTKSLKT